MSVLILDMKLSFVNENRRLSGMPVLTGITWDHHRGWPPLVACAQAFANSHPGVRIDWQARSLHDFGHAPVSPLARQFDLIVLDHPWVGAVAESGDCLPLDDW